MRSGELARLAGVTVRTLRHYHQLGLLVEPERTSGGYREYDVHDLVRLLRIRRLTALGFALEALPALLDGEAHDRRPLLDELDAELAVQAQRIASQREVIARLRAADVAPDLPPGLARFADLFTSSGAPPEFAKADREQLILLAHLAGESGTAELERFYELMSAPDVIARATELNDRYARLAPDASEAEIGMLVDDMVEGFALIVTDFQAAGSDLDISEGERLIAAYSNDVLNPAQVRAGELIESRLLELMGDTTA